MHERSKFLNNTTPEVNVSGDNFIWYNYKKGTLISNTDDKQTFLNFLNFINNNLWKHRINSKSSVDSLKEKANKFYKFKTYERVKKYLELNKNADKINMINNCFVVSI